jgi:tetratricopeptide (TPR) repeat protein
MAHYNLGNALRDQGKLPEAIAEFREAMRLKPDYAGAHNNLGNALRDQGKLPEAVAAYREAMRLKPDYAMAHYNLGNALRDQGKLPEAIAAHREAIRLKPDYAEAHCNLGHMLRRQGHFREALDELRKGHELGSSRPGWRYPSAQWVRNAEHMAALEARLPAVLRGEDKPRDAAEGLAFADMARKAGRYVPSARLYDGALRADPKLADDPRSGHCYNAACAAALAGAGQGEDRPPPDEGEKTRWRKQALEWLKADLALWTKQVDSGPSQARALVVGQLRHWKQDTDLAGIRDAAAIQALPEEEREACRALWADVDALLDRVERLTEKP